MENYKTLEVLGSGGFGAVVKALDQQGKTVALKIIKTAGRRRDDIRKLKREFQIQKDWDRHPNIVKMLDYFQTDRTIGIVTEYAKGDLRALMASFREGLSDSEIIDRARGFSREIINGLHFIHSKKVIHRDIKPDNILIGFDNKPKLGDFGLARLMGDESIESMSFAGTRRYAAPEVIIREAYGVKADIWSFGCVLYELIVGQPLISSSQFFDMENWIAFLQIELPDYVTGNCRNFLEGLLQKTARKRLTWPRLEKHPFLEETDKDAGVRDEEDDVGGDVVVDEDDDQDEYQDGDQDEELDDDLYEYKDVDPINQAENIENNIQQVIENHGNSLFSLRTLHESNRSNHQIQCSDEAMENASYLSHQQVYEPPYFEFQSNPANAGLPPRDASCPPPDVYVPPNTPALDLSLPHPNSSPQDDWIDPPNLPSHDFPLPPLNYPPRFAPNFPPRDFLHPPPISPLRDARNSPLCNNYLNVPDYPHRDLLLPPASPRRNIRLPSYSAHDAWPAPDLRLPGAPRNAAPYNVPPECRIL